MTPLSRLGGQKHHERRVAPTPVAVRVLRYVPVDLHEPLTSCLGLRGWLKARLEKHRSFRQRVGGHTRQPAARRYLFDLLQLAYCLLGITGQSQQCGQDDQYGNLCYRPHSLNGRFSLQRRV